MTIHQGDTIQWQGMAIGFHSIDLPSKGGTDLPFILPTNTTAAGLTDFAGNPFWFNGQPNLAFNPKLFAASGASTYDGSARADSGLPVGRPAPFKLTFTKPGTYVYYCDLHYGMRGIVVVAPKSAKIPTQAQEVEAIATQQSRDAKVAKALARHAGERRRQRRHLRQGQRRGAGDVPADAERAHRRHGHVLDRRRRPARSTRRRSARPTT